MYPHQETTNGGGVVMTNGDTDITEAIPPLAQQTDHLLVFTKHPAPGYAKSRLIPSQGELGAAEISRLLSEHTILTVRAFQQKHATVRTMIHHANPDHIPQSATETWLRPNLREELITQISHSADLGDRLVSAIKLSFGDPHPASKVIVIGTDSPDISTDLLKHAFKLLDHTDVVIGPAHDGGYYLLGMRGFYPSLFENIKWSTDSVCIETIQKAHDMHLSVEKLQTLHDIDELEDLLHLPSSESFEFESKGVFGQP